MMKLNMTKIVIVLIVSAFSTLCISEEIQKSNSELLREAIGKSSRFRSGYELLTGTGDSIFYNYVKGLDKKEDIPFLLDVIKNGPDWPINTSNGRSTLINHLARCYAVLCLASIKDAQAYPVLTDLLQNGKYFVDPNMGQKTQQKYDIKQFAATGLGILGDPNAVDLLIAAMNNTNPYVRDQSMYALTEIEDFRAIRPILNAGKKYEIEDAVLGGFLQKLTKAYFEAKFNRNDKTTTFVDFPELGALTFEENPYQKVWEHWFSAGKNWTKQNFDENYNEYSKVKQTRSNEKDAISYYKQKIANLGIAALPLIIEKIEKGEKDLTPLVSEITNNKVKSDAEAKEVLDWWKANKARWTIFDYSTD